MTSPSNLRFARPTMALAGGGSWEVVACVDLKVVARRLHGRVYQYMCESGAWASFSVDM